MTSFSTLKQFYQRFKDEHATLLATLHTADTDSTRNTKTGNSIEIEEYRMIRSKPLIDEIDVVLAQHYGFATEERDVILQYDIKYRMGKLG